MSAWEAVGKQRRFRVIGDSMSPVIQDGDGVVIEHDTADIEVGDVILYPKSSPPAQGQGLVVHRVAQVIGKESQMLFVTQGDNRPLPDPPVGKERVLGKVVEVESATRTKSRFTAVRGLFQDSQVGLVGHGPRLILGAVAGALLLALAIRGVNWLQVGSALAEADYPLLALAVGTVLSTTLAKAIRWRLLFPRGHDRPGLGKLFSVLLIGQTVNALLPARLGEVARAYLIGEIEGVDKALALSTVIVEKALDALMLLLLVALLFAFMPLPTWLGRTGILVSGFLVALLLSVILVAYQSRRTPSALYRFLSWIPGIGRFDPSARKRSDLRAGLERRLSTMTAGLSTLFRRDVAVQLVSWSVLVWVLAALTNYVTFLALGVEAPFLAALLLLAALYLGVAVPSSPGRVGVFHYVCVLSLSLFSVDRSLALSYGLVLHLVVFAPMMSLGSWFLWRENYELSRTKVATLTAGDGPDP